jgi:hypothetical protein
MPSLAPDYSRPLKRLPVTDAAVTEQAACRNRQPAPVGDPSVGADAARDAFAPRVREPYFADNLAVGAQVRDRREAEVVAMSKEGFAHTDSNHAKSCYPKNQQEHLRSKWAVGRYFQAQPLFAAFSEYGEHLAAISRIVLNTGIRPPKEVLGIKKEHVNLSGQARYCKVEWTDVLLPPGAILVAKGEDGNPRVLPLNRMAREVFKLLVEDCTTGEWLFTNRDGEPMKSIKKGFAAACVRVGIEDLHPYDLRHTFAARLVERGVHHFVTSALLGHSTPITGFGYASRIAPGYAHATWDAMVAAVESLKRPSSLKSSMFAVKSAAGQPKRGEARKAG